MSAPTSESLATRLREVRLARRNQSAPPRAATWDLVRVAVTVPLGSVVALFILIALAKLTAGDGIGGLPLATASGWLVVHQVPLTVGGVTIGVLPMLPTLLVIAVSAMVFGGCTRNAGTLGEVAALAGAAFAGPALGTAVAIGIVADASASSSISQPDPLGAFGSTIGVHILAVIAGLVVFRGPALLDLLGVGRGDRAGLRAGFAAVLALIGIGAIVVLAALVAHWSRVSDLIGTGNSLDGSLGLTVTSLLYLPNVVVAAAGVALGVTVQVGTVMVGATATEAGALPPVPILGAIPEAGVGAVGGLIFLVPLAIGVLLGMRVRDDRPLGQLRVMVVASATAAAVFAILALLASGQIGELGRFSVSAPLAALCLFGWLMAGALVAVAFRQLQQRTGLQLTRTPKAGRRGSVRGRRAAAADEPFDLDALLDDALQDEDEELEIVDLDDQDDRAEGGRDDGAGDDGVGDAVDDSAAGAESDPAESGGTASDFSASDFSAPDFSASDSTAADSISSDAAAADFAGSDAASGGADSGAADTRSTAVRDGAVSHTELPDTDTDAAVPMTRVAGNEADIDDADRPVKSTDSATLPADENDGESTPGGSAAAADSNDPSGSVRIGPGDESGADSNRG